ncbi:MAG: fibronectin type III domain-containing protein, partial [Treponema sp.]|nr:fibronectin type III domain-containing protein [Treponema sp.]
AVTGCDIAVPPGADLYFRVAALNNRDELSPRSGWVRGTSMARPEISDVVPDPADPDRARVVYWYMNNAEPSTYREAVRYTVYCFEGEAERDPVLVDGSGPGEPSAAIGGLVPGSGYSFQVEAYLEGEPGMTELSALWSGQ